MKLNTHFFVFLTITLIVIISDMLIYTIKINYILSIFIGFALVAFLMMILVKSKKIIINYDFEKADLLFLVLICIKIILCINRPDMQYDVSMYHIYNQEYPFIDKVNFDYFPGRTINTFLYPLGDRIFYLSRFLLGYRLGTILSYYSMIVIFYQLKRLVYSLLNIKKDKRVPILSSLIIFIYTMHTLIGSYYIDIFSVVFVLEIIELVFGAKDGKIFENKCRLYFICLLIGISVGIKVPNLIIVACVAIYVLIKDWRGIVNFKIKDYFICIILFLLPFFVYTLDNFVQTGSPIFPYYNDIFKSKWFDTINWKDSRFGIPNLLYAFIWALMPAINPIKTCDLPSYDYIWGIGYIIVVGYLVLHFLKRKNKNKEFEFTALTFALTLVWAKFLSGYLRYAFVIAILYIAVIEIVFIKLVDSKNEKLDKFFIYCVSALLIIVIVSPTCYYISIEARIFKYSWSNVQLFKDIRTEKIHIDGAWMTLADDSKLVTMVREEGTPIYYLESRFLNSSLAKERQMDLKQKELYTIIDDYNKAKKIDELTLENMQIEEVIEKDRELNFLPKDDKVMVCKIKYNANNDEVRMNNLKYYN